MPELDYFALPFWLAFHALSKRRTWTDNGPQPIQFSEILAYLNLIGATDPDEREDTVLHVVEMDELFLKSAPKKKTPPKSRRR